MCAGERGAKEERTKDEEPREATVGRSHLLLGRTPSSSRVVPVRSFGRRAERGCASAARKVVREKSGERTTRVPEVSGGYSVITVPSREPTNQTKRDKDKQRFEPTRSGGGKNKAEARRTDGEGRRERG